MNIRWKKNSKSKKLNIFFKNQRSEASVIQIGPSDFRWLYRNADSTFSGLSGCVGGAKNFCEQIHKVFIK